MMNDVRALCSISDPNLVQLIGAYHAPEKGQARPVILCAACAHWSSYFKATLVVCIHPEQAAHEAVLSTAHNLVAHMCAVWSAPWLYSTSWCMGRRILNFKWYKAILAAAPELRNAS